MCLNCETACPEDVIKFRFLPNRKSAIAQARPRSAARSLAAAAAGAVAIPAARIADCARRELQREGDPAAGRGRGARVPRALHPLRRVHEGVPEQRAAPGVLRGGHRGPVDADPDPAHRLLRALAACSAARSARPARSRRSPRSRRLGHRAEARSASAPLLRSGPLPALGDGDALHRLRRVLPDLAQGHLGRRGRGPEARRASTAPKGEHAGDADGEGAAPARRPVALHRLRRLREGLPVVRTSPPSTSRASARRARRRT